MLLLAASTPPPLTKLVVISLGGIEGTQLAYAQQAGLFKAAGLDVDVEPVTNGGAAMLAVLGNTGQIGYSNLVSLITAHQKGIPVQLLAAGAQYNASSNSVKALVPGDSAVHGPRDLAGKIVAVPSLHDLLTISTKAWLDRAGVDSSSVHFIETPPATMWTALQAHRIDMAVLFDPFMSAALSQGARIVGEPYSAISPDFLIAAWFVNGPWAGDHRDALLRFAKVINVANDYLDSHPTEVVTLAQQVTKIPPEQLRSMQSVYRSPKTLAVAQIQPVVDNVAKYHEIPAAFKAEELIFPGAP